MTNKTTDKISYVTKRIAAVLLLLLISCQTPSQAPGPIPHILVLGLDGISYQTFKKIQDGGHFRSFTTVAPMIASFPSISDPNWALLYETGPEVNYTKAFFDPTIKTAKGMGDKNGGMLTHVSREPKYERIMDFKVKGIWEHLTTFIWTNTTARYWLESLQKQFFDFSGRDTFYALIINTDLVSHTEGELEIMKYLAEIEETINRIQKKYHEKYGKDLEVVLVSDHGNAFDDPQDIPFEKSLSDMGWTIADTIAGPKDIGFYVPELLSFGAFYCQPESSRALAHDFSKVPQVQSAMYMVNPRDIRVFSDFEKGGPAIEVSKGEVSEVKINFDPTTDSLDYKILHGKDPFGQVKLFAKGPLHAKDYFEKTENAPYPNALVRIWEGFNINAKIEPQVLVNPIVGSVFGNKALRLMTDIKGFASTHGSLHRDESLGILASTKRQLSAIRPQDFSKIVGVEALEREKSE